MRSIGYYWTRKDGYWTVNYFHGELWELLRDDIEWLMNDDYFDEIDERQIKREEPEV